MWDLIWSIARVDLGVSEGEFWELNHRQFALLHRRSRLLRWQQEMGLAMNTAAIYRSGMRDFDPMPKATDFVFTVRPGDRPRLAQPQQTREQVASIFRSLVVWPADHLKGGNEIARQ